MENSKVGFAGSVQSAEGSAAREDKEAGRVREAKGQGAAQKGRSRHSWRSRIGSNRRHCNRGRRLQTRRTTNPNYGFSLFLKLCIQSHLGFVQIDQKKPTLAKVLGFEFLGFSKTNKIDTS